MVLRIPCRKHLRLTSLLGLALACVQADHLAVQGGSCASWSVPSWYGLVYMCDGLVSYDFFLQTGETAESLNTAAISKVDAMDGLHSSACMAALKRWICVKTYLPCVDDVDIENTSTWDVAVDNSGDHVKIPFRRPCRSTLDDIEDSCDAALTLIGGGPPNGAEVFANTTLSVYAEKEDKCNRMQNVTIAVAEPMEPYFGSKCAGIITHVHTGVRDFEYDRIHQYRLYFLASSLGLPDRFAPFQPPGYMQAMYEVFITSVQNVYEYNFISKSCSDTRHVYFCHLVIPQAQHQAHLVEYNMSSVYVEKPMGRGVCNNIIDDCGLSTFGSFYGIYRLLDDLDKVSVGKWPSEESKYTGLERMNPTDTDSFNFLVRQWNYPTAHFRQFCSIMQYPEPGTSSAFLSLLPKADYWAGEYVTPEDGVDVVKSFISETNIEYPIIVSPTLPTDYTGGDWMDSSCPRVGSVLFTNEKTKTHKFARRLDVPIPGCDNTEDPWATVAEVKMMRFFPEDGIYNLRDGCAWEPEEILGWIDCRNTYDFRAKRNLIDDNFLGTVDAVDQAVLWLGFFSMIFTIITWTTFKAKRKQRLVLVLATISLMRILVELFGYVVYPTRRERYTINGWEDVPQFQGPNYCTVNAFINFGFIDGMYQVLKLCMAVDVALKIFLNKKDIDHYWKYYLLLSVVVAFFGKVLPWYIINQWAGFDGVNKCDINADVWSYGAVSMEQFIAKDALTFLTYSTSTAIFMAISYKVVDAMRKVRSTGSGDSSFGKTMRLIKTPLTFVVMNTFVVTFYLVVQYAIMFQDLNNKDLLDEYYTTYARECNLCDLKNSASEIVEECEDACKPPGEFYEDQMPSYESLRAMTVWLKFVFNNHGHVVLFLVFVMKKEVLELWAKRLGFVDDSGDVTSYDWTVVRNNAKLKVKRYINLSFSSQIMPDSGKSNWESNVSEKSDWKSSASYVGQSGIEVSTFATGA